MKKFLCLLDFDPGILVEVAGGHAPPMRNTWKHGFIVKFPRGTCRQGDVVVAQFTKDKRLHYSVPLPGTEGGFLRATNPPLMVPARIPYGERTVVRIYPCNPLRPGTDPTTLPRLIIASHSLRSTGMGAKTSGSLNGKILFSVVGEARSATGSHGVRYYLAVVAGEAELLTVKISNSGKSHDLTSTI